MIFLFGFAGFVLLVFVWVIAVYNRFVSVRQHLKESWSDVDVELKRRYNLIPNLVNTVKGYAQHEKSLFESVTAARTRAMDNTGRPDRQSGDEQVMARELRKLHGSFRELPSAQGRSEFLGTPGRTGQYRGSDRGISKVLQRECS